MKKMIIGACAIAFAAVAQAASINWAVNTEGWTLQDGTAPALGTRMWLVDNAKAEAIAAAVMAVDFSSASWESAISAIDGVYGTAVTTDGAGQLTDTLISNSALVDIEVEAVYYDLATLLIDQTSGSYYMISGGTEESWATDNPDNYDTATFGYAHFNEQGTGWQAIPEPTSGLLMLIGMAGLALRRRRA